MKTIIVLAMHGTPPKDFSKAQVALSVGLHMWLEHGVVPLRALLKRYHARLEAKIRHWPRTAKNDPFHAASQELASRLRQESGCEVVVGFNEFCAPSLDEALERAVAQGAEKIVVVTPMMTPGGEHAEEDIPNAIARVQKRHAGIAFVYAWPFETHDVARFLATQIEQYRPR